MGRLGREIHRGSTMARPCGCLDENRARQLQRVYPVPTVHMRATPDTDRKKIRGAIDTYFKETRFDLSDEGHNRMVMRGGGVGSTDEDGNIIDPLASCSVGRSTPR